MTYTEILAKLPPHIAKKLQLKLENCAISNHLQEDEVREIVEGVIHQLRLEAELDKDEFDRELDYLFSKLADAIIGIIF